MSKVTEKGTRDDVDIYILDGQTSVRVWHTHKKVNGRPDITIPAEGRIYFDKVSTVLSYLECENDNQIGVVFDTPNRTTFLRKIGSGNHGKRMTINVPNSGSKYLKQSEYVLKIWWNGPTKEQGAKPILVHEQMTLLGKTIKGVKVAKFDWPNYPHDVPITIFNEYHALQLERRIAIARENNFLSEEWE